MKKILTVSLFAMMAVSAANAEIASTTYVTDRTGTVSFTADGATKGKTNLTEAIAAVDAQVQGISNDLTQDIAGSINELSTTVSEMDAAYKAADTALGGRLTTAEGEIDSLQSDKADKATTLAGYGITDAMTAAAITSAISTATDDMATNTGVAASIKDVTDVMATDEELSSAVTTLEGKITEASTSAGTNLTNTLKDYSTTAQMNTAITEANTAQTNAITTAYEAADATTLSNAKTYAKEYADGLAGNYDAAGSAAAAQTAAVNAAKDAADTTYQVKSSALSVGAADGAWTDLTKATGYSTTGTHSLVLKNGTIQWEAVSY